MPLQIVGIGFVIARRRSSSTEQPSFPGRAWPIPQPAETGDAPGPSPSYRQGGLYRQSEGMTPLQRYLAEEIATDHVDGLLSRREALRRLALLGISTATASTLIAACGDQRTAPSSAGPSTSAVPSTSPSSPPGMATANRPSPSAGSGLRKTSDGQLGAGRRPRGAVLVIHENKGAQ